MHTKPTASAEEVNNVRTLHPVPSDVDDAKRRHPAGSALVYLTPFTSSITHTARFIADHRLPEGDITFLKDTGVIVDLSRQPHATGAVAHWAKVLDAPHDVVVDRGQFYTESSVMAYLPDGTWIRVVAREVTA